MAERLPETPEAVAAILPVDAEAITRLSAYGALVRKWQPVKNLVAPSTLEHLWTRHIADSAQALAALPEARRWLDLGSGAGFPGLVTAILLCGVDGAFVTLVEANGRKAAFLMTVIRALGLPARVLNERIESIAKRIPDPVGPVDAVSARALAPLAELLSDAEPWLAAGARAVFHKGQDFASEHQLATQSWAYDLIEHPSRIDPGGRIVVLSHVGRR